MPTDNPSSEPVKITARQLHRGAWAVGGVALAILVAGGTTRLLAHNELKSWTAEQAVPTVRVVHPARSENGRNLTLPGRLEAWAEAPVYARTNGYLSRWYQDIGSPVKAGTLLAEVDAPELDQQLAAAQANLATAEANRQLAASTSDRWRRLVDQDAVSRQEAEEKAGNLAARNAMANAARADVDRLKALAGFKRIVAPFDGVVTSRATDVGALISAGSGAKPLFTISDMRQMRVYVRVPQNYSAAVKPGMTAELRVPEYPDKVFKAELVRSAEAVNDQSGTMLVQLSADNAARLLKSGAYAQVTFSVPPTPSVVRVPATAMIFRKDGTTVATLDAAGKVQFKPVTVAQDFGNEIEIGSGLTAEDSVIDAPPEALAAGDQVRVAEAKDKAPAQKAPETKAGHDKG